MGNLRVDRCHQATCPAGQVDLTRYGFRAPRGDQQLNWYSRLELEVVLVGKFCQWRRKLNQYNFCRVRKRRLTIEHVVVKKRLCIEVLGDVLRHIKRPSILITERTLRGGLRGRDRSLSRDVRSREQEGAEWPTYAVSMHLTFGVSPEIVKPHERADSFIGDT